MSILMAYLATLAGKRDTITVEDNFVVHYDLMGTNATYAGIQYRSDGDVYREHGSMGPSDIGDWIDPKTSAPGSYEIRATLVSGTSPTGPTIGSWHALTTSRLWSLASNPGQSKSCQLTIEIRKAGGAVLDSGMVNLTADSSGT